MSRKALTLRGGHSVTVGNAVVHVKWARRGEVHLVVEAAPDIGIRVHPRARPAEEPPTSAPPVVVGDDEIPF